MSGWPRFEARDFEELFQGTLKIPWEEMIPENGVMHVVGKSVKSTLYSVPDCQSIVKKAVVEAMKRKYPREQFSENGPAYKIEISLLKDTATLSVDTSGAGLHRRGYREERGEAPLRETLAAALVLISRWGPHRIFADPLCGSGTIAIEAAMVGMNIAPGINRSFASEEWPVMEPGLWDGPSGRRPVHLYGQNRLRYWHRTMIAACSKRHGRTPKGPGSLSTSSSSAVQWRNSAPGKSTAASSPILPTGREWAATGKS